MAQSVFQGLAKASPTSPGSIGVKARATAGTRSEAGIGGMMSWGDYLWFTTYPDETGNGAGLGLHRVNDQWEVELVSETNGTHAGRTIMGEYAWIGEHKIYRDGTVTRLTGFQSDDRITAWAKCTPDTANVYALTMGGRIYRAALSGTSVTLIADAVTGLAIAGQAHFKGMWGFRNKLYVVSNTNAPDGRFGYYDITADTFTRLETRGDSFIEVAGSYDGAPVAFATGQDGYTGFLYMIDGGRDVPDPPRRFLLPLTSRQQVFAWQQEWMRIRTVDTERFLMDFHGGWFALSSFLDGPNQDPQISWPRIEPISRSYRTNTDFTIHNGKLLISGNQSSEQAGNKYPTTGQPQSTIVALDSSDDLFKYGKPMGSGYLWRAASVAPTELSDNMLMRGYDRKELHLYNGTATSVDVDVLISTGGGNITYTYVRLTVPANDHAGTVLPNGDWVRTRAIGACTSLSAWVEYS